MTVLEKFTTHYRHTLERSLELARKSHAHSIEPKHLMIALCEERGSIAADILGKTVNYQKTDSPADTSDLLSTLFYQAFSARTQRTQASEQSLNPPEHLNRSPVPELLLSEDSIRAIEKSVLTAANLEHHYIGTEHLLFGILKTLGNELNHLFRGCEFDVIELQHRLNSVFRTTSRFPDVAEILDQGYPEAEKEIAPRNGSKGRGKKQEALSFFATLLTSQKAQKFIDPVIGRTQEIARTIQILGRRMKNNPVLIGEPGVGKTAIVEGLAKRILAGDVPDMLLNKKIYALDLPLLVAGTTYRGEFELRLKQVLEELKSDHDSILFIDEIHTIIGAGSGGTSMDAANILKPMLARGDIRCIGATTLQEYKRYIETDPALERRFQPVLIQELSVPETIAVIQGIKQEYEKHHQVTITPEAIEAAAILSHRYLPEKFLPDKAIDLVDEAASHKKLHSKRNETLRSAHTLEKELEAVHTEKRRAVRREAYAEALSYKQREERILLELQDLKEKQLKTKTPQKESITREDIERLISEITNIPVGDISAAEKEKLTQIEDRLKGHIFGQDEALTEIARFLKRARTGLSDPNRPLGSFLFLGPTGVGKTQTAQVLAREMFSENALIRIDMSEFGEPFAVSRLIGAPPGYIGFREGGKLTEAVRRKPYSVILFDEIEKAHPDVFHILLQVLDSGRLTDAEGKTVDFKNCVVILTSNIGMTLLNEQAKIGFSLGSSAGISAMAHFETQYQEAQASILKELKRFFRPEFLNRLDSIIFFAPLHRDAITKIVVKELERIQTSMQAHGSAFRWNTKVVQILANSYDPQEGGRGIKRIIQKQIEGPLADLLLTHGKQKPVSFTARVKQGNVELEIVGNGSGR